MRKKLICSMLILCALFTLCTYASELLSPGMNYISKDLKIIKTCSHGDEITFKKSDFSNVLGIEKFDDITITSLPDVSSGTLKFGNLDVFSNQVIAYNGIEFLRFIPNKDGASCSFTFNIDGKKDIKCLMYVVSGDNSSPTGESFKLNTVCNIPVFSCMRCTDADGDELEYKIISQPENGTLTVTDTAIGSFKYVPSESFTGKDSFTYRAIDKYGNKSDIFTVCIKTNSNPMGINYYDMADSPAQYACINLAQKNILVGEKIGDNMYFSPDEKITRCDFLVMSMKCASLSPNVFTQNQLSFKDSDTIPDFAKGYIASAVRLGVDCNYKQSGENVFAPFEPISELEALEIANSLLSVSGKEEIDPAILFGGIIETGTFATGGRKLSRENCALILNQICDICE